MQNDMSRLFDLDGRVALVSGGSSGIGKTIGLALARAGASVVLVARRAQELACAAGEFEAAGLRARALTCDLSDREALRALAARAAEPFGAPDILVNASGINVRKPFEDTADEDWDRSLAINLTAPFLLTRALAPAMRERGWGRIINITSLQCVRAFPDSAPYGASKGGLMQLTRAIAEYWSRHGVTCNAIAPGFFETPLTASVMSDPARVQALAASTMMGRNGRLDDLHGAAVFLASEASAYITGQTLFVDGGFSAR
ncbi:Gluconate 5-dehydrogenase [Achromobacter insolitus]|uniref:SDR family NAD(P)-dependent oxidoreductase n=1 Tax=Achromobacter insolitus TaxID=217204 RepID=UPI000A04E806|nr:glucose 1-dehydrogenase [Achromobacter insolitus]OWT64955.1 gluconate 5-dehydrogenase [Achromobacter insolitus]CAB3721233.1 Gluconate 5-dehydrogenase [Achromobacter insolitus]VEG71276.1 Gluconate 5-dehydrogenase [Achromobacter insolitus]